MRWRIWLLASAAVVPALVGCPTSIQSGELPLRQVSETPLTGGPVRFDYLALDAGADDSSSPTWAQVNSSTLTCMHTRRAHAA